MPTELEAVNPSIPGTMKINWKQLLIEVIRIIIAAISGGAAAAAM